MLLSVQYQGGLGVEIPCCGSNAHRGFDERVPYRAKLFLFKGYKDQRPVVRLQQIEGENMVGRH